MVRFGYVMLLLLASLAMALCLAGRVPRAYPAREERVTASDDALNDWWGEGCEWDCNWFRCQGTGRANRQGVRARIGKMFQRRKH